MNNYTSPYSLWEASTQGAYEPPNTVAAETDGWRTRSTGTPGSWTTMTQAQYDESNLTADETDGWRIAQVTTSPYTAWNTKTQAEYEAGNTSSAETDGWRTRTTGTPTSWTFVTAALFNESNITCH